MPINNRSFSLPRTGQSLNDTRPTVNKIKRKYSSVRIQKINRSSTNKNKTNLLLSDPDQLTYSSFDLRRMKSSSNNQGKLFWHRIFSEQTNQSPNYFDKMLSLPNHGTQRSHPFIHAKWVTRSSTHRKRIRMRSRSSNKIHSIRMSEESSSQSNKVTRRSLE